MRGRYATEFGQTIGEFQQIEKSARSGKLVAGFAADCHRGEVILIESDRDVLMQILRNSITATFDQIESTTSAIQTIRRKSKR